jgi:hypothetical protein
MKHDVAAMLTAVAMLITAYALIAGVVSFATWLKAVIQ